MDDQNFNPPGGNGSFYDDGSPVEEEEEDEAHEAHEASQHASHNPDQLRQKIQSLRQQAQGPQQAAKALKRITGGGRKAASAGRTAAQTTAKTAQATGRVVSMAGKGIVWLFTTPVGWIILGIILVLLIVFFVMTSGGGENEQHGTVPVHITKIGPAEVKNGENINYTISVDYAGNAQAILVTDQLPINVDYVSASGPGSPKYDSIARKVTWTLQPNGGSGGAAGGPNIPPNTDTCNGVYTLTGGEHNGDNFGDPSCSLAKSAKVSYDFKGKHFDGVPQAMLDLLQQLDPQNVGYWVGISSCESPGFDPNNVSGAVNGKAYGLFQMGSSYYNGQEFPYGSGDGLNGPYDRGDVNWQTQISNAVNYNKSIGGSWSYWECAKIVWGLW